MNQIVTTGIILTRTDYGEADRILTILTPDHGKIKVMAKGVRKIKSKLAGGIELFCESQISLIKGKGEIDTLVSTRLLKNYGSIVKNYERTMLGYEHIKQLNKATEDGAGKEYYDLTVKLLGGLDDPDLPNVFCRLWFELNLLKLAGVSPELKKDLKEHPLKAEKTYKFNLDEMTFEEQSEGPYNSGHIKLLRLGLGLQLPNELAKVRVGGDVIRGCLGLVNSMLRTYLRI